MCEEAGKRHCREGKKKKKLIETDPKIMQVSKCANALK